MEISKPDYTDVYKFLTSLGVIFLFLGFLIPWLFLNNSFEDLSYISDISKFPTNAQQVINYRLDTYLWIIENLRWISITSIFLGCIALFVGLSQWRNRQKLIDKRENIETNTAEFNYTKLTEAEITSKMVSAASGINFSGDPVKDVMAMKSLTQNEMKALSNYRDIEKSIIDLFRNCYGNDQVQSNLAIDSNRVDLLLTTNENNRKIIEIHYISDKNSFDKKLTEIHADLERVLLSLKHVYNFYEPRGIAMIILDFEPDDWVNYYIHRFKRIKYNDLCFKFLTVPELEILEKDCRKFRSLIEDNR